MYIHVHHHACVYQPALFAMFVENGVKSRIHAAFNSVKKNTCIHFKESKLPPSKTSPARSFVVVFSDHGKRYLFCVSIKNFQHSHDHHSLVHIIISFTAIALRAIDLQDYAFAVHFHI